MNEQEKQIERGMLAMGAVKVDYHQTKVTIVGKLPEMTPIRQTIADYMKHCTEPSRLTLEAFVGMIETGEAVLDDFRAVGGEVLAVQVKVAIRCGI